jgi:hypothetical protein
MEPSRFDELTKALATATSRRAALKTIAATTLGGILGLAGVGTAFAKCHGTGHNCEENSTCCSGTCCIASGQREGVCCGTDKICQNGTCVTPCAPGLVRLSNGSCALPCSVEFSSCGSCGSCGVCRRDISGSLYCNNSCGPFIGSCTSDSSCDTGYFCYADPGENGACVQVCSS